MEVSNATISACTTKSLIVRQLQCSCITSSSFAGNDEIVAVEESIDVGNVRWIFYDCLSALSDTRDSLSRVAESAENWLVSQFPPIRDLRIKMSDFFCHIRRCSFDLLTLTFQGQTFLDNS